MAGLNQSAGEEAKAAENSPDTCLTSLNAGARITELSGQNRGRH